MGPKTCAGFEGSFNHEQQDAATFANWGIDFVEEDSCYHPSYPNGSAIPYHLLYARMRDALNATGRPIVFYSCVQGQDNVFEWGPYTANLWRTTSDICAPGKATWDGMLHNFRGNALYPNVSGPGQWQVWPGWMCVMMGSTWLLLTRRPPTCPPTSTIHAQDPDMLVVGMPGLTPTEWRTHFR